MTNKIKCPSMKEPWSGQAMQVNSWGMDSITMELTCLTFRTKNKASASMVR